MPFPKLYKLIPYALGTLIFLAVGIYDGYPLLNSDSNAYINSGFDLFVPNDRPIVYGLFLKISSLGWSLWLPVIIQAILLNWLLYRFFENMVSKKHMGIYLLIVCLLSAFTTASWYASMVMPDAFTPILGLTLLNLYSNKNSRQQNIVYIVVAFFVALMHNSHLILLTVFSLLLLVVFFFADKYGVFFRKSKQLFIVSSSAWLITCLINLAGGNSFTPGKMTPIFLVGKFGENGLLNTYLDENCGKKQYMLCQHKDYFPNPAFAFVWFGDSPLQVTGGWEKNRQECADIVDDVITSPKYLSKWAFLGVDDMMREVMMTELDNWYRTPWCKFDEETAVYKAIQKHLGDREVRQMAGSKQNTTKLNTVFFNVATKFTSLISSLFVVLLALRRGSRQLFSVYSFLIIFLLLNAYVVANFANVLDRLNSRVVWLLTGINLVMICSMLIKTKNPAVNEQDTVRSI